MQHAVRRRWERESPAATMAWSRMQFWLHDRYYAVVVVVILASGVGLVLEGDRSWSSRFIWVGIGTVVAGGVLGGVVLKSLAKRRLTALEAGDTTAAEAAWRRARPIEILLTTLVLLTVVSMVHNWGAR